MLLSVWMWVLLWIDGKLAGSGRREAYAVCARSSRVVTGWRILVGVIFFFFLGWMVCMVCLGECYIYLSLLGLHGMAWDMCTPTSVTLQCLKNESGSESYVAMSRELNLILVLQRLMKIGHCANPVVKTGPVIKNSKSSTEQKPGQATPGK